MAICRSIFYNCKKFGYKLKRGPNMPHTNVYCPSLAAKTCSTLTGVKFLERKRSCCKFLRYLGPENGDILSYEILAQTVSCQWLESRKHCSKPSYPLERQIPLSLCVSHVVWPTHAHTRHTSRQGLRLHIPIYLHSSEQSHAKLSSVIKPSACYTVV